MIAIFEITPETYKQSCSFLFCFLTLLHCPAFELLDVEQLVKIDLFSHLKEKQKKIKSNWYTAFAES
jgi:hypothetical protein